MTKIQKAVEDLIKRHGSLRKAQAKTGINYAYLHRLLNGEKINPSDEVLAKIGIQKHVIYRDIK